MNVPEPIRRVLDVLEPAYLVGGAVRDAILGVEPEDYDITTAHLPEKVRQLAETAGLRTYPVGEKFGTVGIHAGDHKVEVTTMRAETYDMVGRKPNVVFTDNLALDLSRRDISFGAIAISPSGEIIDPYGGQQDIKDGVIRFVGDAKARILEDPLRMFRAIRFAARYDFRIEAASMHAITNNHQEAARLSGERIRDEVLKILATQKPERGLALLAKSHLLHAVLPELETLRNTPQANPHHVHDVWGHTLAAVQAAPNHGLVRLAALFHDVGKPATRAKRGGIDTFHGHDDVGVDIWRRVAGRLRFSTADTDHVAKLIRLHLTPARYEPAWSAGALRRHQRELGSPEAMQDLLALARADAVAHAPESARRSLQAIAGYEARLASLGEPLPAHLLAKGCGLAIMEAFNVQGPQVRELLQRVESAALDGRLTVPVQPEQAVAYLRQ